LPNKNIVAKKQNMEKNGKEWNNNKTIKNNNKTKQNKIKIEILCL
jgi:hypothetical protein